MPGMEKAWLVPFSALPKLTCHVARCKSLSCFVFPSIKPRFWANQSLWGFPALTVQNVSIQGSEKREQGWLKWGKRGGRGTVWPGPHRLWRLSPNNNIQPQERQTDRQTPTEVNKAFWTSYQNRPPTVSMKLGFFLNKFLIWDLIFNLQKNCKDSTQSSLISHHCGTFVKARKKKNQHQYISKIQTLGLPL